MHDHVHEYDEHVHDEGSRKANLLLAYMVTHNEQHAKELGELADKLEQAGNHDAANAIRSAVSDYQNGNKKLQNALEIL